MSESWLTTEEVRALGVPRATLYWQIQNGRLMVRQAHHRPRGKNGKAKKEILLSSLPAAIQRRYLKSQISDLRSQNESPAGTSGEGGESAGAARRAGAEANLPSARLSPTATPAGSQISNLKFQIENPLAGLAEEELEKLTDYAEALGRAEGEPRRQRRWIARSQKVSLSTLDRDVATFKEEGLAGLVWKTRADKGRPRVGNEQVVAKIQTEYLKLHRPTAKAIYAKISTDYQLSSRAPPSFTWVLRQIEQIPQKLISRYRLGEKHYRDHYEYSSTRRRPALPRQWVDADHHEADHYVVFPDGSVGRPFITTLHDLCTGEILALRIPRDKRVGRGRAPGAVDIGLAVRQAILRKESQISDLKSQSWPSFGLFERFYHDLGKDFLSSHLRAVLADLHIKPVPCRGYHGQSKPIERWFRTLEDGTRDLPGYCGNKPENNPYRSAVRPQKPDPKTLMTLEDYERAIVGWVVTKYHHAPSTALGGISPLEALAAHVKNGFSPRELRDERALDLLLMRRARRAGGEMIQMRKDGFRLFGRLYMHPELAHLVGEEIDPRYDENNLGEIICYHKERFVCVATNKELLDFGATKADLKRANEIRREQKRRDQEWYEERIKQAQYGDPAARAVAERNHDEVMEEERKKIAVGAEAEGVPMLMPKYQRTVKLLGEKALHKKAGRVLREVKKTSQISDLKSQKDETGGKEPWEVEEELPTGKEIFKRERNPWIEEDA